jgi:hypothetical protein
MKQQIGYGMLRVELRRQFEREAVATGLLTARRYRGVGSLPGSYDKLLEEADARDFFLSARWFTNFERTIVSSDEAVTVYGIESPDLSHPVGAFMMWQRASKGIVNFRVLQSLANYYTPYCGPILDSRYMADGIQAFAHALSEDRRLFALVDLRCLDPAQPYFATMVQALSGCGFAVQTYFQFGNWYLDVNGRSFAEYVSTLPTVLKKNIPYQTRRLERTHRVELKLVASMEGLDQSLQDYEAVYHSSWRDEEAYPGFIRGLAESAARAGSLRLGLLYADGIPVAAQFWLVHAGVASIYKIAYVEKFAKFSVGTVLTAHMMRQALDVDRVSVVDYLSGDDDYKKDWMSHRRERWGILAFNLRSLRGIALAGRHLGGRRIKQMLNHMKKWKARKGESTSGHGGHAK